MHLYLDNDAILKLSAYNFLEDSIRLCGGGGFSILDTAGAVMRNPRRRAGFEQRFTLQGLQRAIDFVSAAPVINRAPDEHIHHILTLVDDMDPGETILFGVACLDDDSFVLTGDKKSIRQLATEVLAETVFKRLRGRVICLEEVILGLIKVKGYPAVRRTISAMPGVDLGVTRFFPQQDRTSPSVTENLVRRELASLCPDSSWLRQLV